MQLNRFWSSVVSVAGFLLIVGWLQYLFNIVIGLFGLLHELAPGLNDLLLRLAAGVLPIWSALTFIDWRWGWKGDNAGFRTTRAAIFWYLPGLLGGVLAAFLAWMLRNGFSVPALFLTEGQLLAVALLLLQVFVTELVYRGIAVSRFQSDLSGWERLAAAALAPLAWTFIQGAGFLAMGWPSTFIIGLGTAALSVFLTLLFLRTDSVWLSAGLHGGLQAGLMLLALPGGAADQALLLLFAPLAAVLLYLEWKRKGPAQRPSGPRRGPQRVVFSKTVRGPWGPH